MSWLSDELKKAGGSRGVGAGRMGAIVGALPDSENATPCQSLRNKSYTGYKEKNSTTIYNYYCFYIIFSCTQSKNPDHYTSDDSCPEGKPSSRLSRSSPITSKSSTVSTRSGAAKTAGRLELGGVEGMAALGALWRPTVVKQEETDLSVRLLVDIALAREQT